MATCPNCGTQQPDGAAFCDECGARLSGATPEAPPAPQEPTPATQVAATCPDCGAPVVPGEAFCDNCGAALTDAAPPKTVRAPYTPPPPEEQEEELTCPSCGAKLEPGSNFCDMCGAPVGQAPAGPPPFQEPEPEPAAPPHQATKVEPSQPAPPETLAAGTPVEAYEPASPGRLVVQGANATLPLPPGSSEVTLGREDPVSGVFPEIDLTDYGADEAGVSREHARITIQGSQVTIEDLDSLNFTYVNQEKLRPGEPHALQDGDEIRLGRLKLTYAS